MERFAAQRLLAERPPLVLSDPLADEINSLVDALLEQSGGPDGAVIARKIGPVVQGLDGNPLQMEMRLAPGFVDPVYDAAMYRKQGIGAVPGEMGTIDALTRMDPQKVREISFGWSTPQRAGSGQGKLRYGKVQGSQGVDYQGMLKAAHESLLEEGKLRAGDLLTAMPQGLADGDFRRALTYLNQGYGMPDQSSGLMSGQLTSSGGVRPVQLFSAEPALMNRMRFKRA